MPESACKKILHDLPSPLKRATSPPVKIDSIIPDGEDLKFLHCVLNNIFRDQDPDTEAMAALMILKFVSSELRYIETMLLPLASDILKQKRALCDGFCKVFIILCRLYGIPARDASLYGIDSGVGHNLCEAYCDGRWILFDPTYGFVFYAGDIWEGPALLRNLYDLINGCLWKLFKVVPHPWNGFSEIEKKFIPERPKSDYLQAFTGSSIVCEYPRWIATAYPVTYRQAVTCFPVEVDLRECGQINLSTETSPGRRRPGWERGNGSISIGFAFMNMVKVVMPENYGKVSICYRFKGDVPQLQLQPLSNMHHLNTSLLHDSILFTVSIVGQVAICLIFAETSGRIRDIKIALIA